MKSLVSPNSQDTIKFLTLCKMRFNTQSTKFVFSVFTLFDLDSLSSPS